MRKIQSKKELEAKQRKKQRILGIVLVIVMFGSVFGIIVNSFNSSSTNHVQNTYKGYELINQNGYFVLKISDKSFYFSSNPNFLEHQSTNITKTLVSYASSPLYIDSSNKLAHSLLYQNIYPYAQRMQDACINESDCSSQDVPIKTCSDNVIVVRQSNESKVYQMENCIFILGPDKKLPELTDSFILKVSGIN